ncbi:alcohol acetyltransferase-domain-containing protein [Ilyonectria robusta]|uniref:alcohol acetyltransferase-domain-containing protein n=1 Tax=Ilyonectria robusta TaxID=1079257 RepID=UPI001E8D9A20|nr:alcohol acetyltransferase-domain-containing protein [Ilyonectria robusta]KAH8722026.1 alcohol acetyltransferase-domain-containing protein [Ilyonectria robusta]
MRKPWTVIHFEKRLWQTPGPCRFLVSIQAGLLQAARATDAGSVASPESAGECKPRIPRKRQISIEKIERRDAGELVFIIGAPRTVRTHGSAAGSATAAAFCEASPVGNATYLVLTVVYCAVLNRPAQNRPSIQVKHAKSWPSSPSPRGQAAKRSTPRLQVDHSPSSTVISGAARRLYHSPRSCFYDRMFFMFHRLGIQSNILVSARYAPAGLDEGNRLSRTAITAALRSVVEAHSALRIVGVVQQSPKGDSHHLHIGMLHSIDLDHCIEFVDDVDGADADFFEKLHNKWEWFEEDSGRPWWRVYVVGGRDVVFVLHHLVADANSGIVFHRTLLRGLNSLPLVGLASVDPIVTIDPNTASLFPEPMSLSDHKPSIPELIWGQIKRSLVGLIFGFTLLFSSLQPAKPYFASITEVAPPEMRTVTRVSSLRIPARKMSAVLAACRANGTTFTALLAVMLLATFSVDLFPQERLGGVLASDGVMMNAVGGSFHTHWLGYYRSIVTKHSDKSGKLEYVPSVNAETTWKLARSYRRSMLKHIPNKFMRSWMAGTLLGGDLESFVNKALEGMGRVTSKSFFVSNLGAFTVQTSGATGEEQIEQPRWGIEDVQFSAATVNGNVGSRGFVFNVAGVRGGDTVVNVSYEEGVVSRGQAEDLLALTMDKIESLLESEQRRIAGLAPPDPWDFGGENMVIRESTSRFESIVGTRVMPFPSQPYLVPRVDLWVMASRDLDVGYRPVLVGNEGESLKTGEECKRSTRRGMGRGMSTWQSVSPVASVMRSIGFP